MFSRVFCKISKNTNFTEQLWTTASVVFGQLVSWQQIFNLSINKDLMK